MKLRHFVSGSAVVLAGWLGVTFVMEVPAQRYQQRHQASATEVRPAFDSSATVVLPETGTEISQHSVSP
jgi:hypothetical protein